MGRGSGKGRGAGGGGRGTGNQPKVKKTLSDHIFYTGAVMQASNFVKVKKFLINHIKKSYDYGDDISGALKKDRQRNFDDWLLDVRESKEIDPIKAAAENARLEW